jgi:hypothetical protein
MTCTVATGSCLPQVLVTNQVGTVVWNRAATHVVCTVRTGHRFSAGAEVAQVVVWNGEVCVGRDPNSCPGRFVRPGRYRADASWTSRSRGSVRFLINA